MSSPSATNFTADLVPQAPEDALFGLMRAYRADQSPNKVDLVSTLSPYLSMVHGEFQALKYIVGAGETKDLALLTSALSK